MHPELLDYGQRLHRLVATDSDTGDALYQAELDERHGGFGYLRRTNAGAVRPWSKQTWGTLLKAVLPQPLPPASGGKWVRIVDGRKWDDAAAEWSADPTETNYARYW